MKNNADIAAMLADGALSGEEKREAENLVSMNPQAKSEYQAIMNLKRVLREKLPTIDISTALLIMPRQLVKTGTIVIAKMIVSPERYSILVICSIMVLM